MLSRLRHTNVHSNNNNNRQVFPSENNIINQVYNNIDISSTDDIIK
jgi:hypothetical protein